MTTEVGCMGGCKTLIQVPKHFVKMGVVCSDCLGSIQLKKSLKVIPPGWRLFNIDASILNDVRVVLARTDSGRKKWAGLSPPDQARIPLFMLGVGVDISAGVLKASSLARMAAPIQHLPRTEGYESSRPVKSLLIDKRVDQGGNGGAKGSAEKCPNCDKNDLTQKDPTKWFCISCGYSENR